MSSCEGSECIAPASTCEPGSVGACSVENGVGRQSCQSDLKFGACEAIKCNANYELNNKTCQPKSACKTDETLPCTENGRQGTRSCHSGTWSQTCEIRACAVGEEMKNGICVKTSCRAGDTQTCTQGVGTGTIQCGPDGRWSTCSFTSCSGNYALKNGSCLERICNPKEHFDQEACAILLPHSKSYRVCNDTGTGGGDCIVDSCESNYKEANGECIRNDGYQCDPGQVRELVCYTTNNDGNHPCRQPCCSKGAKFGTWGVCIPFDGTRCVGGHEFDINPNGDCI